ncbi:MAG: c-type cytochrome [Saprospiraceae bacterium]
MKNASTLDRSILISFLTMICFAIGCSQPTGDGKLGNGEKAVWKAPDSTGISKEPEADLIMYGRELIRHTASYLGPKGSVAQLSNGMNCQNCHLEAGTKAWGNNYSGVQSTYPKYRARSGESETVVKRVNDCFQRSLNGQALPVDGREMNAILAYIKWLGKDVTKGEKPKGAGLTELAYLDRPADSVSGADVFARECAKCHGADGAGAMAGNGLEYLYPPLWGPHSYNVGAGLFRLSRFAGYVKSNMPYGDNQEYLQLTDPEVWDLAAFVNSRPRPGFDMSADWPKIKEKPIDHPFGPYADAFSEMQHKFGPFQIIKDNQ